MSAKARKVYSTATGDQPRGELSLVADLTELPPADRKINKPKTRKAAPRTRARNGKVIQKSIPDYLVDPRVLAEVRRTIDPNRQRQINVAPDTVLLVNRRWGGDA